MSRLLIDTNILVYMLNMTLDDDTTALIEDYNNQIYVSSVSVMEFIHLLQNNRVASKRLPQDIMKYIEEQLGFRVAYTTIYHLKQLEKLPTVEGHNDPNDRLIISQAISDGLELVSSDTKFSSYKKYGLQYIKAVHASKQ